MGELAMFLVSQCVVCQTILYVTKITNLWLLVFPQ